MLYKVSFTFSESYRPKVQGYQSISLVVEAPDKFQAMHGAWLKLKPLQEVSYFTLGEPESFECSKVQGQE